MTGSPGQKWFVPRPADKILFISDVHLGGFTVEKNQIIEKDFLNLLEYARLNQYSIVVLGDLFDYYMQYDSYIPEVCHNIFRWFSEYHTITDNRSLYITGNHDYWDNGMIAKIGFDVEHEYRLITLPDKSKVIIFHGDGLSDTVFKYPRPLLHRLLRSSIFVNAYQFLTNGKVGNRIMKGFSQWKRTYPGNDTADKKRLDNMAKRILQNKIADVVICGHHHQTRFISDSHGLYINTGAFFIDRTLSVYTNQSFRLVRWDGIKNELISLTPNPGT
jgi:UDP-2,3-diacylglucosamine hydrolase